MVTTITSVLLLIGIQAVHTYTEQSKHTIPALLQPNKINLSNKNEVDVFHSLSLSTPIAHLEWKDPVLSLDIQINPKKTHYTEIYKNMARIIQFSFYEIQNIDQLLLRVVLQNKPIQPQKLLLAADIKREDCSSMAIAVLRQWPSPLLPPAEKGHFCLIQTDLWHTYFHTASSYR